MTHFNIISTILVGLGHPSGICQKLEWAFRQFSRGRANGVHVRLVAEAFFKMVAAQKSKSAKVLKRASLEERGQLQKLWQLCALPKAFLPWTAQHTAQMEELLRSLKPRLVAHAMLGSDTALHVLAQWAPVEAVLRLMYFVGEEGERVQNAMGYTTLLASFYPTNRRDITLALLRHSHESTLQDRTHHGESPLLFACRAHDREMVALLISRLPNAALHTGNAYGETPLHMSCFVGSLLRSHTWEEVEETWSADQLVRAIPVEGLLAADQQGNTPLHYTCKYHGIGVDAMVERLPVESLGMTNKKGHTALHLAALNACARGVRALLPAMDRCDIERKDRDGFTAMDYATKSTKNMFRPPAKGAIL